MTNTTADKTSATVEGVALANAPKETLGDYISNWFNRVRAGDLGSLPIIIGLILIAIIFGILEPLFFSPRNFVNLLLQMAGITTIAIGIVFVLLIAVHVDGYYVSVVATHHVVPNIFLHGSLGFDLLAGSLHADEEPVRSGAPEPAAREHRVVKARESVQEQHSEEGRER